MTIYAYLLCLRCGRQQLLFGVSMAGKHWVECLSCSYTREGRYAAQLELT